MASREALGPLERLAERAAQAEAKHRADVAHVQQHHPELAAFLTEMAQAFGKGQVDYRVVMRDRQGLSPKR